MYLKYKKNFYSQNGEDGIIQKIIDDLNLNKKLFVCEFGAWDGKFLSNIFYLVKKNLAKAIMIESDKNKFKDLIKTAKKYPNITPINKFVSPTGNNSLDIILEEYNFPYDFDILSIDIDSNDLEIWENLKKYEPKILIIEINSSIVPGIKQRHNSKQNLLGNSFTSTLEVANKKKYTPIAHTGNLILVRNDLINKMNVNLDLLKNPNKLFIYDFVNKKDLRNNYLIKILKKIVPNFIRNAINAKIKNIIIKLFIK